MPIVVKLDDMLHARRMTLTELAGRMGITLANKLREGNKKIADFIEFQSELALLSPAEIDQAGLRKLAEQRGHELGPLVVAAELIGKASIRIGADQRIGDAPDLGDVGAHLLGTKRAV